MEHIDKLLLHVGCANRYYEGFINSDLREGWKEKKYKLDLQMDMSKPWPYEDGSVDGIVGMSVFQQLHWRELVFAFREILRVLKKGGVLRMGIPFLGGGKPLDHILGWNNVNVLTYEILERVLMSHIKFSSCRLCNLRETDMPEFAKIDNRTSHTFYMEAIK